MLDVLAFPERDHLSWEPLCARLEVGAEDEAELVCLGMVSHLGRMLPCAWHVVLHRSPCDGPWTHLYRVLPDHAGRVLVLLHCAEAGDARHCMRQHAVQAADLSAGTSGRGAGLQG